MKFSTAVSLCLAPLVIAKEVHNKFPHRAVEERSRSKGKGERVVVENVEVVLLWSFGGGNARTQSFAPQATSFASAGGSVNSLQPLGAGSVNGVNGVNGATGATGVNSAGVNGGGLQSLPGATNTLPGAASQAVGAAQTTHSVLVGGPSRLYFTPDNVRANVGDVILLTFLGNNHSVTQSAFATPCQPLAGGMDSGFQPNQESSVNPPPQVAMQVMVTTPLWFFCRQTGHCGKGMTLSINPTAEKTQSMFQQMAIAQNGQGQPSAITGGQSAAPAGGVNGTVAGAGTVAGSAPVGSESLQPLGGTGTATGTGSTFDPLSTIPAAGSSFGSTVAPNGATFGSGTLQPDGSCVCMVMCGATGSGAPASQDQAIGNFGGIPGSVDMSILTPLKKVKKF